MLHIYLALLEDKADEGKFTKVYEKYRQLMLKEAYTRLRDYGLAEDCVQNAFCDIAKNFKKVGDIESPSTKAYVMTITRTCAFHIYKKAQKRTEISFEDTGFEPTDDVFCEDEYFRQYEIQNTVTLIQALPDGYREPLLLHCVHDYEYSHIADLMGLQPEAVRKRVQRAKAMVKEQLKVRVHANG